MNTNWNGLVNIVITKQYSPEVTHQALRSQQREFLETLVMEGLIETMFYMATVETLTAEVEELKAENGRLSDALLSYNSKQVSQLFAGSK